MDTRWQLRMLNWILTAAILFVPIITGASRLSRGFVFCERNRWVHFLAYMAVAAIPLIGRRWRRALFFVLAMAILGAVAECVRTLVWSHAIWPEIIAGNLFGLVAGTLLGLNIRAMRMSSNTGDSNQIQHPEAASL